MKLPIYYVDAFTDTLFSGNPAAVIFSDINDSELMQNIAAENNLSETAFIRKEGDDFIIRWFAPSCEINLCGHATLASAFVYFNYINTEETIFNVKSLKNGVLTVSKKDDLLLLDFPKDNYKKFDNFQIIQEAFGIMPNELYEGRDDILAIFDNEDCIASLSPNFELVKELPHRGIIASAPGNEVDFVSRCFFPSTGVDEDPVTGSAHTTLTPYWSNRLDKKNLTAKQLSKRGGELQCQNNDSRVIIGGKACLYMIGSVFIY